MGNRAISAKPLWMYAICVLVAVLQGWAVLKTQNVIGLILLFVGLPGAVPFLVINGVHGDMEGAAGVVGGVLYVLTNGAVYYGIVVFVRWLLRRKRVKAAETA